MAAVQYASILKERVIFIDIFDLSAKITLDITGLEEGVRQAQTAFEGLQSGAAAFGASMDSVTQAAVSAIGSQLPAMLSSLNTSLDSVLQSAAGAASGLSAQFTGAWSAVQSAWSGASSYFSGIAEQIHSAFSGLAGSMSEVGSQMWQGLRSGLSSAADGVKSWSESIVTGIRDALGIHSPSRVMAEIGRFMAQGLGEGWSDSIGGVMRGMQQSVLPDTAQAHVDFSASAVGKSSAAAVSGIMASSAASSGSNGGTCTVNLVVDGRTLANVLFDPLTAAARQKGVTIGA